ncbi:hypothetical protein DMENIID0001_049870 [Sergentomyia squamirostris]
MMYLGVAIFVGFLTLLLLLWTWNFTYWSRKGIKGPKPSVIFGNFPTYLQRNLVYDLDEQYKKYRGIPFVGIYALRSPMLLVTDPEFSRQILIGKFRQFYNNESSQMLSLKSDPIIGLNPFFLRDEKWKNVRQEITPGFSNNRVKAQFPIIQTTCHKMINYLRQYVKTHGTTVKVAELSRRYTNENLMNCIFGLEGDAFIEEAGLSLKMLKDYLDAFWKIDYFLVFSFVWPTFNKIYKFNVLNRKLKIFFEDMLRHGMEFRTKQSGNRDDFLAFLMHIQEKKGATIDEMVAHALTFILDGFETSALVMDSVFYELTRHPEVQEKLREEILAQSTLLTYENVCDLPYLDQVINETTRLYPPILFLIKQCNESLSVEFDDGQGTKTIPKGAKTLIPVYSIQRDPMIYENPEKFYPERFNDGAVKDYKDKGVLIPFGDGPRICLGMKFAVAQIKMAIVEIVKNFRLTLGADMKEPLTLKKAFFGLPMQDILVNFHPISQK